MDIEILHMALTGRPDDDDRTVTKAIFTARVGPVQLSSCAIVRQGDGHVMAMPPLGKFDKAAVRIRDDDMYMEFRRLAFEAYDVLVDEEPDAGLLRVLGAENESLRMAGI